MYLTDVIREWNRKYPDRQMTHLEMRNVCRDVAREQHEDWPTDISSTARWVIQANERKGS